MEETYENVTYSESSKQMPERKSTSHRWLIILLTLTFVALFISVVAIISVFIFCNPNKFAQETSNNVTEALQKFEAQIEELKQMYAECAQLNSVLESRLNASLKAVHFLEEVQSRHDRSIDAVEVKMSDLKTRQTQQETRVMTSMNSLNHTVETNNAEIELALTDFKTQQSQQEGRVMTFMNSLNHTVETNMAEIELALTDFETQQSQREERVMTSVNSLNNTIKANMAEVELALTGFETQQSQQEARIMTSVNSLSSTVEQHHAEEVPAFCPAPYVHNPYTNTCIRLISLSKPWEDAKNYCEIKGEYLATFETLESIFWFVNLRKTHSGWVIGDQLWIGARRENGLWRWKGKSTGIADTLYWGSGEPAGSNEHCLTSFSSIGYQINNSICSKAYYFVCEKLG